MTRSGVLFAVASVLAGIAVIMAIFGAAYNLVFFLFAVPFAAAASIIWLDATGRLATRIDWRRVRRDPAAVDGRGRERRRTPDRPTSGPERERRNAERVLGVGPDADEATVRRAYRERVKEAHPDADGGSEEAFKRITDAYERLAGERP